MKLNLKSCLLKNNFLRISASLIQELHFFAFSLYLEVYETFDHSFYVVRFHQDIQRTVDKDDMIDLHQEENLLIS